MQKPAVWYRVDSNHWAYVFGPMVLEVKIIGDRLQAAWHQFDRKHFKAKRKLSDTPHELEPHLATIWRVARWDAVIMPTE